MGLRAEEVRLARGPRYRDEPQLVLVAVREPLVTG